jgi:hypothetical protein
MIRSTERITYLNKEWITDHGKVVAYPIVGDVLDMEASDPDYDDALFVLGLFADALGLISTKRRTK